MAMRIRNGRFDAPTEGEGLPGPDSGPMFLEARTGPSAKGQSIRNANIKKIKANGELIRDMAFKLLNDHPHITNALIFRSADRAGDGRPRPDDGRSTYVHGWDRRTMDISVMTSITDGEMAPSVDMVIRFAEHPDAADNTRRAIHKSLLFDDVLKWSTNGSTWQLWKLTDENFSGISESQQKKALRNSALQFMIAADDVKRKANEAISLLEEVVMELNL